MDPADQSSEDKIPFWPQVMPQVVAGLILLAVAGIGYIGITVPRQLDLVLENQKAVLARQGATEGRLEKTEGAIIMIDRRVTRLEVHQ
jgi:hypothetical protein